MKSIIIDPPDIESQRFDNAVSCDERRQSTRFDAVAFRSWIGWWEGDRFEVTTAILTNISRGGALLQTASPLEVGARLWFCLHADPWIGSVTATVLEASTTDEGPCHVRISFDGHCPDAIFEVAVLGIQGG